jgi:APA family basic amino acid/polyamine antiporter
MTTTTARPLRRILGVGFGLALAFGTTVGVGILRLPGTVAATLGDRTLIIVAWGLGGLYALMGAVSVAELAAMIPETGGFRVYARRAFGEGVGFAVGWLDWLCGVAILGYVAVTAIAFLGALWQPLAGYPRIGAVLIIVAFTGINWIGLRVGSSLTAIISAAIGLTLMILIVGCFVAAPVTASAPPVRTLPRAIIGGALLVVALYLLINVAFLRVLPLAVLAASDLPAADAARVVMPRGGAAFVTVISLLTILSALNNNLLSQPRILFAIGRDGLFTENAAIVSKGGTPRVALAVTSVFVIVLILTGTFEQIVALSAVLFLAYYIVAYLAVFVLRVRSPNVPRPYKALGYPVSTAVVLAGSVAFLVAAVAEDPRSGLIAAVFLACCVPAYAWAARSRRRAEIQLAH